MRIGWERSALESVQELVHLELCERDLSTLRGRYRYAHPTRDVREKRVGEGLRRIPGSRDLDETYERLGVGGHDATTFQK